MKKPLRNVIPFIALAITIMASARTAEANPLFTVGATSGATTVNRSFNRISDSFDTMNRANLVTAFSGVGGFNPDTSPLAFNFGLRGLAMSVTSPAGSNAIVMSIPAINFTTTFNGANRDASVEALKDWFKKDGGKVVDQVVRKMAEVSPVEPLAGNPNSVQASTVNTSFDRGFGRLAADSSGLLGEKTGEKATENANMLSIGARYRMTSGDFRSQSATIPLGYTFRFDDDARHQISVDIPITYQQVETGQVYNLGFGLGYSHPINSAWVLTGGVDYGATASLDLGSGGHVITGTVTSLYTLLLSEKLLLHIGNMAGQSATLPISAGDYSSDPGIENTVIKNGIMFYTPTPNILPFSGIELFALDTRFFGSKLYNDSYTEIGTSFGFSRVSVEGAKRYDKIFRIGFSGIIARNNNGFMANMGYSF